MQTINLSQFNKSQEVFRTAEGSYGHYVSIKRGGKTVARVPWGPGDGEMAERIARALNHHGSLVAFAREYMEWAARQKYYDRSLPGMDELHAKARAIMETLNK